jgi:heme exporter protein B
MMLRFKRELCLQRRQWNVIVNAALFFFMIMVFLPLTLPADALLLRHTFPGLVWIAVLFSFFLSAERLFQQEEEDGVIEQWLIAAAPVHGAIFAKLGAHWFVSVVPIILFCPVLALLFGINTHETIILILSLLCGTPALLTLCALSAAFSTGIKQKSVLMALILLPLTLPVMILGSGILTASMQHLPMSGALALLLAISLAALLLLPYAIVAVIRVSVVE